MKTCGRCKEAKATSLFSRSPQTKDGLYGWCKPCVSKNYKEKYLWKEKTPEMRAMRNAYRASRRDYYRKKFNEWDAAHREQRRMASRERYARNRKAECERQAGVREKFKDHCRARWALGSAIRYGKLKKKPCQRCGTAEKVQGHHHKGYEKKYWLDVVWLCGVCHGRAHREEV